MAREQSLADRSICRPGETPVDDPQHLRGSLAPLFGHAVIGRDRATADRSPQAADGLESVRCIFVQDHHGNESAAVNGRQKGHVDAFITDGEPSVPAVSFGDGVGPQNVVSGNRHAQRRRLRFEQNGAGIGDRGPERRLVQSSKCGVQSEKITPIALRSGALARLSSARFEQVRNKILGIGGFVAGIPTRDLKY